MIVLVLRHLNVTPCVTSLYKKILLYKLFNFFTFSIQVFDPRGRFMFNFGRKGSQDGELMRPTGVAVGHDGNIIVADRDNHRIQVFSSEGRFVTKFGTKGDGDGQLNDPHGLALTPEGNIIVADFRNNRVQLFGQPA